VFAEQPAISADDASRACRAWALLSRRGQVLVTEPRTRSQPMNFQDRLKKLEDKLASLNAAEPEDLPLEPLPPTALDRVQGGVDGGGGGGDLDMDLLEMGGSRPRGRREADVA
jgi:hypothetical protein